MDKVYALLLIDDRVVVNETLRLMHQIWVVIVTLESSKDPEFRDLLEELPFVKWAVVREPLLLPERAGWVLTSPAGQACLDYVRAMVGKLLNSLAIENTYNDLRENEGRGARH